MYYFITWSTCLNNVHSYAFVQGCVKRGSKSGRQGVSGGSPGGQPGGQWRVSQGSPGAGVILEIVIKVHRHSEITCIFKISKFNNFG